MRTARSAQAVLRTAAEQEGAEKYSLFHMLRQSVATQLMERGVNIREIQSAPEHAGSKTT
jgi:site-specific recombinase XerD